LNLPTRLSVADLAAQRRWYAGVRGFTGVIEQFELPELIQPATTPGH
jgi:hypothetical protein